MAITPGINYSTGTQLTTYTLALATTAEFTQNAGGKAATSALLGTFVNELNRIVESELAIRFQLHSRNDTLIFENAATDGYSNGNVGAMINENYGVINQTLNGSPANDNGYDFGHVLGIGNDGGSGGTPNKASGATDLFSAQVTTGSVTLVVHELAHQLGASHSYNGQKGGCNSRNAATAVEPGSGSTIMSYEGSCGTDNLPVFPGDDQYFHAVSFDEIIKYTTTQVANRGTKTATANQLPIVNAGVDRTIPAATPFTLTATAADSDAADRLTYTWEQIDASAATEVLQSSVLTVSGRPATLTDTLNQLQQTTAAYVSGDKIRITGTDVDGTAIQGTYTYEAGDTLANLLTGGFLNESIETSFYDANLFLTTSVLLGPQGNIVVASRTAGNASLSLQLQSDPNDGRPGSGRTEFGTFALVVDGRNDAGAVSLPIPNAQDQFGPLFRSFGPSSSPSRTFPRIEDLVANVPQSQNKNEHLPTQNRPLNFRVTARDNHLFQGRNVSGIVSDDVRLNVVNTGAPFRVTSLNAATPPILGGSRQTITWDVAGTTANGIDTTRVDILLSQDGGLTYPTRLATATANDGGQEVLIPNIIAAKARIKIQADPAQNIFFDINDAEFQIAQDLTIPGGVVIVESGGNTHVAEGQFTTTGMSQSDTYTIALTAAPTSDVDVTITADAQVQVSVDGVAFAATRVITFSAGDATPKTITVRSVNDAASEGFHKSIIRHAVTRSNDPNYSPQVLTADTVGSVTANVSDDEAPPLIGVEFDNAAFGTPKVPVNWTLTTNPFTSNVTDAIRENGLASNIDLAIELSNPAGSAGFYTTDLAPSTIPMHSPEISGIDGIFAWEAATVTATWSGLAPNTKYRVYTFASADTDWTLNQTITVTGSGIDNPAPFTQNGAGKNDQLFVNSAIASNTQNLEQYALVVTANATGQIIVRINRNAANAFLLGLAIQEFLETPPGFSITETNGGSEVAESGITDTFAVTLDTQPATNVVLTIASAATAEVTTDKSTLTFTPANWNTPQTVTLTGVQDNETDGNKSVAIMVAVNQAASDPRYATVPAKQVLVTVVDTLPSAWQNVGDRYDVNDDGLVVPLDVLRIFNELNQPKYTDPSVALPAVKPTEADFYDVDGNGFITPLDGLGVINFLNRSSPEGESFRRIPIWVEPDDELAEIIEDLVADVHRFA